VLAQRHTPEKPLGLFACMLSPSAARKQWQSILQLRTVAILGFVMRGGCQWQAEN
jgi:hypothetical protein